MLTVDEIRRCSSVFMLLERFVVAEARCVSALGCGYLLGRMPMVCLQGVMRKNQALRLIGFNIS